MLADTNNTYSSSWWIPFFFECFSYYELIPDRRKIINCFGEGVPGGFSGDGGWKTSPFSVTKVAIPSRWARAIQLPTHLSTFRTGEAFPTGPTLSQGRKIGVVGKIGSRYGKCIHQRAHTCVRARMSCSGKWARCTLNSPFPLFTNWYIYFLKLYLQAHLYLIHICWLE